MIALLFVVVTFTVWLFGAVIVAQAVDSETIAAMVTIFSELFIIIFFP